MSKNRTKKRSSKAKKRYKKAGYRKKHNKFANRYKYRSPSITFAFKNPQPRKK